MPDAQHDLLAELVKTGKPVVLLNFSGRPMILNWENQNIPAILEIGFGGSETADAIADVVFGKVCPSGKLSTSFPRNVGQLPYSYAHYNTGRPLQGDSFVKFQSCYMDVNNSPLYPFGYGMSYTQFSYSPISLSSSKMTTDGSIKASVTVTNIGKADGAEIVQLYLRDLVGSVVRPVKELKGFERIFLKAGESRVVDFTITPDLLKYYNNQLEYVIEPGNFQVMIGTNSEDVQVADFVVE